MSLIGRNRFESVDDFPHKFSTIALDAAIEFDELSRQVGKSFAKIQKLVNVIDIIIAEAEKQPFIMYPHQPCALYILDLAFAD